ncbi:hypothetical protein FE845_17900 [Marinobacter sp. 1-4A]|uniref:hypothetical protein n=1 Tax=Marinobacter sp. 1-4A TaxID=2582919 RepID=UPI0019085B4B|nr:hypothetical protein [Marinobacter sp. 1-4A]MBK1853224.1 hypothetical protein [Marinobacter sp. 1-4A]
MDIEFILPLMTAIAGILGIISGIRKTKSEREDSIEHLRLEIEENMEELEKVLSKDELEDLVLRVRSIEKNKVTDTPLRKEHGNVTKNFLVYIVPGMIALGLVGLYIFLRASNAGDTEYSTPEDLNNLMTIVVGYLFGAGAASV